MPAAAAEHPGRLSSGPHFSKFCRTTLRHTMKVPDGPAVGSPFALEVWQDDFWDEALELEQLVDQFGQVLGYRRVYSTIGMILPRKNGKTTQLAAFGLYAGGPWDGEHRPTVVLAAGSLGQTGELWDQANAFIDDPGGGSPQMRATFIPRKVSITCPGNSGVIRRVASDGKLNHSLNIHVVIGDELWAWKTPRQRENWNALASAGGARDDPLKAFITTEGEDEDDVLFDLMERIEDDPNTKIEVVHKCLTIYRNRVSRTLVYRYGCPPDTSLDDLDTIKLANPASWRTRPRLEQDLADTDLDENARRRLYMGIRVAGAGRWISDARIDQASTKRTIPKDSISVFGCDAAKTRDTTAVGWAWIDPKTNDAYVDLHVWSCRPEVAADTYVEGGRLDNDDARNYIRDVLLERFAGRLLFYDERYFDTQANDLSQAGLTAVEMHQGKPEMVAAWNEFYAEIHKGPKPTVWLPAGERGRTLRSHIRAAKGKRNAAGDSWIVRKEDLPIDGLAAVVMALYGARHFEDFMPKKRRAYSY